MLMKNYLIMTVEKTLIVTPEEEKRINSTYQRSEEEIAKDVEDIKEWLKKQPHLPPDEDELRIKNMLLLNKCSLEKTKQKLDFYYSLKHVVPEIYENREPLHPEVSTFMDNTIFLPLPRLTSECHRVYIFRFANEDASKFDMIAYFKCLFGVFDLRMMQDFALGDHFIVDFEHAKFGHIVQFTPANIKKGYTLLEKAYSDRIKGMHFLNLPSFATGVVTLFSSILSEKLANRVIVHKDFKSLHKSISKEILPYEYKGKAGAMDDLYVDWRKYLNSKNEWIKEIGIRRSDESKRFGEPLNSDLFGMCGSFRKLNVD